MNPRTPASSPAQVAMVTTAHPWNDVRIFVKESRSLARAGVTVTIIAPGAERVVVDDVQVVGVSPSRSRWERFLLTGLRVFRAALATRAGIVHFHDPDFIPWGVLLAALGRKVVYDSHENLPDLVMDRPMFPRPTRLLVRKIVDVMEKLAARSFTLVVVATPKIQSRFRGFNTLLLRNYPTLAEFEREPRSRAVVEDKATRGVYVGGISLARGFSEAVTALSSLPVSSRIEFDFVGRVDLPSDCLSMTSRQAGWARCRMHGLLGREGVISVLERARFGLVALHATENHLEALPIKLFEYMAAGLPVIASDFPLWRNIVETAGCGLLVNPLEPDQIAKAIRWVEEHPEDAVKMGLSGRKAVLDTYNWESEAAPFLNWYRIQVARD